MDGVEHVHYDRTYHGLPVIGGDLIVHESPSGAVRTVELVVAPTKVAGAWQPDRDRRAVRGPRHQVTAR